MSLLEVNELSKNFGSFEAVANVSFKINEGKVYSIIGPNGAGKTTLFNIITGHLKPSCGSIRLSNKKINGLSINQISLEGIARSFQINNIFPDLSVRENLRLAVQSRYKAKYNIWKQKQKYIEIEAKTEQIINKICLVKYENKDAKYLSHGDKRILEIGIALATEPRLLLMDEPTSGMAPEETKYMINFIKKLSKNFTLIVIEHKMNLVMDISDEIIVLCQGQVIAMGKPNEVQNDSNVKAAYLGG